MTEGNVVRVDIHHLGGDRYHVTSRAGDRETHFTSTESWGVGAYLWGLRDLAVLCSNTIIVDEESRYIGDELNLKPGQILVDHGTLVP